MGLERLGLGSLSIVCLLIVFVYSRVTRRQDSEYGIQFAPVSRNAVFSRERRIVFFTVSQDTSFALNATNERWG